MTTCLYRWRLQCSRSKVEAFCWVWKSYPVLLGVHLTGATLQLGQQSEVCCILPKENNEHLCRILAGATLQLGQQNEVCCVLPKENNGDLCRILAGATLQLGQWNEERCVLRKENHERLCRTLAGATLQLGQQYKKWQIGLGKQTWRTGAIL